MKWAPNKHIPNAPKVNHERCGGSQCVKHTCSTCWKNHFRKCLAIIGECYIAEWMTTRLENVLAFRLRG